MKVSWWSLLASHSSLLFLSHSRNCPLLATFLHILRLSKALGKSLRSLIHFFTFWSHIAPCYS